MRTTRATIWLPTVRTAVAAATLAAALLTGCDAMKTPPETVRVPVPAGYPLTTQRTMQAMHHWDVLAADVATRVRASLESRTVERSRTVHVAPPEATDFGRAFQDLLMTRLLEQGLAISMTPADSLVLSFDVQLVTHDRLQASPATKSSRDSRDPGAETRTEAMVTSTLSHGDVVLMRHSAIQYVDGAEWRLYRLAAEPERPGLVQVRLVDR